MNNNLWINKYKPFNLSEIIGNKNQINKFKEWLHDLPNNKNQAILISGKQGLGKTLIIKLILEEFKYIVKVIKPNDIKDHRIYDDFNDYYNFLNSIYSKIEFNNYVSKKIALIFDETENISLNSEKKYVLDIFKYNNKFKSFPLIFIYNNQHSKLLNDLKKYCNELIFTQSSNNDLTIFINNILLKENIKVENETIIEKIILFSQYDIRRLINILQELSYHLDNNIITNNNINEFIEKSREKNIDIGLYESTNIILNNFLEYDNIIKLYESEKVLLPLMIHENYIKKVLTKNKGSTNDILHNLINISDSISKGDNIETSIYTDQNWYLQNIHGFYTCINTSYWINKNKNYNIKINDIKFGSDLNKTSLKNINKKNINNLSKLINIKSNQEILMLNKICNHFINNNKEKTLINILYNYNKNISIKEIELCLKIDKTVDFNIFVSKDKKRINNEIKNNII
jgi:replication factor C subunit 1